MANCLEDRWAHWNKDSSRKKVAVRDNELSIRGLEVEGDLDVCDLVHVVTAEKALERCYYGAEYRDVEREIEAPGCWYGFVE